MTYRKTYRYLLLIVGVYSLITALWALIDIDSFMKVTGPKTDIWLVKTVSVLILAMAVFFIMQLKYSSPVVPVIILGILMSVGLASIDFYYTSQNTISDIYKADGFLQLVFMLIWSYLLINYKVLERQLKDSGNN